MEERTNTNGAIHYIVEGSGLAIVLLHGVASSLYSWRYLIPELSQKGYRPIALDLPGHGDSLKPTRKEDFRFDRVYPYVADWIDDLGFDQPCVLVGHSLGGALSLQYALDQPDQVAGLVLIDPFYYPRQVASFLKTIKFWPALWETALRLTPHRLIRLVTVFEGCDGNPTNPEIRLQMAKDYKRASPGIVRIPSSIPDLSKSIPSISSPALVIWGEKDPTLQPESFFRLIDDLPNSNGYAIPDCGHNPHLGSPELVNRLVCQFVDEFIG